MGRLEIFRERLFSNLEDKAKLLRTVNGIEAFGLSERELVVGWIFGSVHAAWESFLEDCFLAYMLGAQTDVGFAPKRYIQPRDEQHALDIILAGREFFR